MGNPEKMKAFVAEMSVGAFIALLLGYIIGSFASGFVMRKLSQWDSLVLPLIVGLLGTAGWFYTVVQIPHPMWVIVLGFLCYIPFAILGYRSGE
jgi:ABC-type multidrug transport system permease subunit